MRRTYWVWALTFGLIGASAAIVVSLAATPQYQAHTALYVSTTGGAPVSNASYQETTASQQIALSLAKLIPTEVITQRVVQSMNLDMSPAELSSKVTAVVEPETVLIDVTVTDASPTTAREIANGIALEFSGFVDELVLKKSTSVPKPQVTLIAPAATPTTPVSPNSGRNIGLGLAAGLALGLAVANLRVRADSTVRDVRALTAIVGAPNIGRIAAPGSETDRDWASEGFKELRTNLLHTLDSGRPSRIVCVTSAGIGEGKTTTVIGVATALSDAGYRTVVVDGDLRDCHLSSTLGLSGVDGLAEFLSDSATFDDIVHEEVRHGIEVIPAGHRSDRPSELLTSELAGKLYALLGERYDFVFVDTPALLAYTDAAVVAGHADGVAVVARHGGVTVTDLESAVGALRLVQAPVLGSVLTFAPLSNARRRRLLRRA